MPMTREQQIAERDRALRRLESAAASAIYNGATEDEILQTVRSGMAEAQANPNYQGPLAPEQPAAQQAPEPADQPLPEWPTVHEPRHAAA
jgi:hypothetical protein